MERELNLHFLEKHVIRIAKSAARLARKANFEIQTKDAPANIVTTSDLAVQELLCRELKKLLPCAGFLCEEANLQDTKKELCWVIDPIDGTTNYSRGIAQCAVSVALVRGEECLLGVVYDIYGGSVFSAVKGGGARLDGKPIRVSERRFENALFCTAMSLYRKDLAAACRDIIYDVYMEANDIRRFGSCALELCYLAAGHCELYFEMRVYPWDYAAAYLVLSEAGGVLTGFDGTSPSFYKTTPLIGANNRENYTRLAGIVKKHLKEIPYEEERYE